MGRKRKALKLSCYYCDRDFVDEQTLILHQRARHFRCGSCDRQFLKVGDLVWHAQKKHGEAVLKASALRVSVPLALAASLTLRTGAQQPAQPRRPRRFSRRPGWHS